MGIVLGVNSAYHESAAAAVEGGVVLAAAEEERWSRRKHGKAALPSNPDELPWRSIEWALEAAGASPRDVEAVAYGFAPRARLWNVGRDPLPLADPAGWGGAPGERAFEEGLARLPAALSKGGITAPLRFVPHHRAHAASAFYPSPFERAAVLVLDGIGEHASGWLGRGIGARLTPIARIRYPDSLGLLWERVSVHLGFGEYDAGKVMALAALGDAAPHRAAMRRVLRVDADRASDARAPAFRVDLDLARFRSAGTAGLSTLFGPPRAEGEPLDAPRLAGVAAALQEATEEAVLETARRLSRLSGERHLAYAGGVALNCVANARLERDGPFESIYIPPAPHDAGTAVGAALEVSLRAGRRRVPGASPLTPFLGPAAGEGEAIEALRLAGLPFERALDAPARAAEALARGALVGWFQGALELGPRALGHRSVLADPRRAGLKDELNRRVKHREAFRPFGASILAEECAGWLAVPPRDGTAPSRELMLFAYPVRPERRHLIPAVVHRDGTCRIQTVEAARDPRFHELLRRFAGLTGVPLVLNTSFNDSEPIVRTPSEAVRTFLASGIDELFIGDVHVRAARRETMHVTSLGLAAPDDPVAPAPEGLVAPAEPEAPAPEGPAAPRDPAVPAGDLLFPIVEDALGPRLAIVLGNEAPAGECPFYRAKLCHHCDIGRGEGARFDAATNRRRLAWYRARYAAEWPRVAHLVVYNSGSALNRSELSPEVLDEVVRFARGLPALKAVSLDSREGFVEAGRLAGLARALGPSRRLSPILGLESADDAIRDGLLEKRMGRAGIERAAAAVGAASREAASYAGSAALGLAVNLVVGGPGAAGALAAEDARASARYSIGLAQGAGVPLELSLHPYYPSARGLARFPDHARPALSDVLDAARAVLEEIRAARAPARVFVGLHDEGHDRRPGERPCAVDPLRAALARFHREQDAAALREMDSKPLSGATSG